MLDVANCLIAVAIFPFVFLFRFFRTKKKFPFFKSLGFFAFAVLLDFHMIRTQIAEEKSQ